MNNRRLRGRAPKKTAGFCWGRVITDTTICYRLFRRDQRGALHYSPRVFQRGDQRASMAEELKLARHQLRNTVDDVDLALMGVV